MQIHSKDTVSKTATKTAHHRHGQTDARTGRRTHGCTRAFMCVCVCVCVAICAKAAKTTTTCVCVRALHVRTSTEPSTTPFWSLQMMVW